MPATDHIRNKLSQLPHKPGVYLMKDRFGTVIYVGKARDLRKRVSQYFHPSRRHGWDLKLNALVEAIQDFDTHVVRNEPESLLLEGKLIKEFHPRFNIDFRDDKRFLLLKINLNDPIPRFILTRLRKEDGARYFGPFAHSGSLRRTVLMARKKFNLRGCRALTPTESDYKHCLYANLKVCTAPCIANVTREQYLAQVMAACDFIGGQTEELRAELEAEMKRASAAQEFEKAASLRDAIEDLKKTSLKTEKFERIPYTLPVAINPEADLRQLGRALGLSDSPARIEGFDISNISGTFAVASMVSFWHGRPDRANYRRFKMKNVTGQDDFACMAETVRRRYSRLLNEVEASEAASPKLPAGANAAFPLTPALSPEERETLAGERSDLTERSIDPARASLPPLPEGEGRGEGESNVMNSQGANDELNASWVPRPSAASNLPDLIVIDGGKGQLNAACAELAKLGLSKVPIIGLAKEFEEIYRPGEKEPLRLGLDNNALKMLQRVRDESHRFANTFNAQLRLKKISESLLDEFPGIGDRRKAALLKKFGSIQRLRTATLEQIAEVPGFGGKAAAEFKAWLDARHA